MRILRFGQPIGGIIQTAYVVENIETSALDFTARLGVGPWFITDPFRPPEGLYRGAPTHILLTLAIGFSGNLMIELIQQHDEGPSVYRETITARGYGFHHWAVGCDDLDKTIKIYQAAGYSIAFSDRSPRGIRVAYMDKPNELPGMIELIELNAAAEDFYTKCRDAAVAWDGTDPLRTSAGGRRSER